LTSPAFCSRDNYGVAKALGESDLINISAPELLGSSGGALTAVGLVLGLNFDEITELALQCVGRCHGSVSGAFDLRTYLTEVLDHQFESFAKKQAEKEKESRSLLSEKSRQSKKQSSAGVSGTLSSSDLPSNGNTMCGAEIEDNFGFEDDMCGECEIEVEDDVVRRQCVTAALAGRVSVSVTTLPWLRNKRYRSFDDPAHVKQVLIASCW
jgi:hypothetical protein